MNTREALADLLTTKYGVSAAVLIPETAFSELGLDSLTLAELMFDLEDTFQVTLDVEWRSVGTLGDVIALVERARGMSTDPTA